MSNRKRRSHASNVHSAVDSDRPFTFQHKGHTYRIPPAAQAQGKIKAGQLIDSVMGDSELAELRFGLSILNAVSIDREAMDALRDKPLPEFTDIISRWMRATGADPGESQRSST